MMGVGVFALLMTSMMGVTAAAKVVATGFPLLAVVPVLVVTLLLFFVEGVFVLDPDRERRGDVGAVTDSMIVVLGAVVGV